MNRDRGDGDRVDEPRSELDRRQFLRRAAATGVVTAWAAPVVQTVLATPALANGTPFCGHSVGPSENTNCNEGAKGACKFACNGECGDSILVDPCTAAVDAACVGSPDRPCCNPGICNAENWTCGGRPPDQTPCYEGPTGGCSQAQIDGLHQFCEV